MYYESRVRLIPITYNKEIVLDATELNKGLLDSEYDIEDRLFTTNSIVSTEKLSRRELEEYVYRMVDDLIIDNRDVEIVYTKSINLSSNDTQVIRIDYYVAVYLGDTAFIPLSTNIKSVDKINRSKIKTLARFSIESLEVIQGLLDK